MKNEKEPSKYLVAKGREWHSKFHKGLGYRICEDDFDLQALTLTMNQIKRDIIKEYRRKR